MASPGWARDDACRLIIMLRPHAIEGDVCVALGKKAHETVLCGRSQIVEREGAPVYYVDDVVTMWWQSVANVNEHAVGRTSPSLSVPPCIREVREDAGSADSILPVNAGDICRDVTPH